MTDFPYPFPVPIIQEVNTIRSVPAVDGTQIKNIKITETVFPEGNSIRRVETYSVMVYDAVGRLNSYLYGYGNIDRLV